MTAITIRDASRSWQLAICLAACFCLLRFPGSVLADDKQPVVKLQPRHEIMGPLVRYYRPIRIQLGENPAERLTAEPDYTSDKPQYGTLKLGVGEDNLISVVVDESEDLQRIYIDRNNDEDLTNDGDGKWTSSASTTHRLSNLRLDVPYDESSIPYVFQMYRFKTRLRDVVLYYRNSAREGELVSEGKRYKVAVLDENADGRFDDLANGTLLIDLNQDGKLVGRPDSAEYHSLGEPFNIHGKVWEVASATADGTSLTLAASKSKVTMKLYIDVGSPAPLFTGAGLDDKAIELRSMASDSKYILLDFWASWCGPCRSEYPYLRKLHAQYKDHGLQIVGITLDSDRQKAIQMAEQELLAYPHVFDGLAWKNKVAALYRVRSIPQTLLLDGDLQIVAKGLRGAALERKMKQLLGDGDLAAAAAVAARQTTPSVPAR